MTVTCYIQLSFVHLSCWSGAQTGNEKQILFVNICFIDIGTVLITLY